MATVQELLHAGSHLQSSSHEEQQASSGRRDTEILLCHALGKPRAWLYTWPEKTVSSEQEAHFRQLLKRRSEGEPVAYLTGTRDFWTLQLSVSASTLIPRPETETLVSWALELPLPQQARVADLGTGTGAIALALASERSQWVVSALDSSAEALRVAAYNAQQAGLGQVEILPSHWYEALAGRRFDLLVSNPPYIAAEDPHLARGDLRFEPRAALVASGGGLDDLAHLVSGAGDHLQAGGWLLLEHGYDQGAAVRQMLAAAGFSEVQTRRDLAGLDRISGGRWHAE